MSGKISLVCGSRTFADLSGQEPWPFFIVTQYQLQEEECSLLALRLHS